MPRRERRDLGISNNKFEMKVRSELQRIKEVAESGRNDLIGCKRYLNFPNSVIEDDK